MFAWYIFFLSVIVFVSFLLISYLSRHRQLLYPLNNAQRLFVKWNFCFPLAGPEEWEGVHQAETCPWQFLWRRASHLHQPQHKWPVLPVGLNLCVCERVVGLINEAFEGQHRYFCAFASDCMNADTEDALMFWLDKQCVGPKIELVAYSCGTLWYTHLFLNWNIKFVDNVTALLSLVWGTFNLSLKSSSQPQELFEKLFIFKKNKTF